MEQWRDGNEQKFLEENGYTNVCLKDGEWCGTYQYMFSVAILRGLNEFSFVDRWCYHDPLVALSEFEKWDGTGEPQHWHRHLPTMRRRDPENTDIGVW